MKAGDVSESKKILFPEILTVLQARIEMAVYLQGNTINQTLILSMEKKETKNKLDSSLFQRHDSDFLTPNEMELMELLCE